MSVCALGWLDDIGLPQYKTQFDEGKVDGRMLHYMSMVSKWLFLSWHIFHVLSFSHFSTHWCTSSIMEVKTSESWRDLLTEDQINLERPSTVPVFATAQILT